MTSYLEPSIGPLLKAPTKNLEVEHRLQPGKESSQFRPKHQVVAPRERIFPLQTSCGHRGVTPPAELCWDVLIYTHWAAQLEAKGRA